METLEDHSGLQETADTATKGLKLSQTMGIRFEHSLDINMRLIIRYIQCQDLEKKVMYFAFCVFRLSDVAW